MIRDIIDINQLGVIVFSRMNSSRLPGKALLPLGTLPLLARVLRRAKLCGYPVYLATSKDADDDCLEDLALSEGVPVYRGSKENVLERATEAANTFNLKAFARLCGDRPLFDIDEIANYLRLYQIMANNNVMPDLITNHLFKQQIPGRTTEVIDTNALLRVSSLTSNDADREHLTKFFYENKKDFFILSMPSLQRKYAGYGYAIDTKADYERFAYMFNLNSHIAVSIDKADEILFNYTSNESDHEG